MNKKTPAGWACKSCNKNCSIDDKDYFMLKNEVWLTIANKTDMLCMDCTELRLGRALTKDDILSCVVTLHWNPYTKAILNQTTTP